MPADKQIGFPCEIERERGSISKDGGLGSIHPAHRSSRRNQFLIWLSGRQCWHAHSASSGLNYTKLPPRAGGASRERGIGRGGRGRGKEKGQYGGRGAKWVSARPLFGRRDPDLRRVETDGGEESVMQEQPWKGQASTDSRFHTSPL